MLLRIVEASSHYHHNYPEPPLEKVNEIHKQQFLKISMQALSLQRPNLDKVFLGI